LAGEVVLCNGTVRTVVELKRSAVHKNAGSDVTAEVSRYYHAADFDRHHCKLVCDPPTDRQPVELKQKWRGVGPPTAACRTTWRHCSEVWSQTLSKRGNTSWNISPRISPTVNFYTRYWAICSYV